MEMSRPFGDTYSDPSRSSDDELGGGLGLDHVFEEVSLFGKQGE